MIAALDRIVRGGVRIPLRPLGVNNSGASTTVDVTGVIARPGSLLIATVYTNTGQSSTVTDTRGNAHSSVVLAKMYSGFNWLETFYVPANNGAGPVTITATVLVSTGLELAVYEWPGQAAFPIDGSNHSDENAAGTVMSSGPSVGRSANVNDLVFGVAIGSDVILPGPGFTELSNSSPGGSPIEREWKWGAGNSAASAIQATSGQWAASVVTFKRRHHD